MKLWNAFMIAIVAVPMGVVLWWIVAYVIAANDVGIALSDYAQIAPENYAGMVYSFVVIGIFMTLEHGLIGLPACIAIVALVVTAVQRVLSRR